MRIRRLIIILLVVILLASGGYYVWGRLQTTIKEEPPQLVKVRRDLFVHEILGRGNVDSAQNVEIRCRVESAGQNGLIIEYIIEEGTIVNAGDLLVQLDSAVLRENTERQQVVVITSESNLTQARAELKAAELALKEYTEGTLEQERKTIDNRIFTAEETVRTQTASLSYYERLLERGYITQDRVDADTIELKKAIKAKEIAELDLFVLENYTKEKMEMQYQAAIEAAKSKVDAFYKTFQIDSARLAHLERQLSNCSIYAPSAGQVVYYLPRWAGEEMLIREGTRVFNQQILMQLPDPTQMQVRALINEANVRHVQLKQNAAIKFEAFLNQTFEGVVTDVKNLPEPTSWQASAMSREYLTTVRILDAPADIRSGLTAEARIVVQELPNVLLLPAQAVFGHGDKTYAITYNDGYWDKVEVTTGSANDKDVVILEGLKEGDEVVLGAWVHRDKVDLPKIDEVPEDEDGVIDEEEAFLLEQAKRQASQQREGGGESAGSGNGSGRSGGGSAGGGGGRP